MNRTVRSLVLAGLFLAGCGSTDPLPPAPDHTRPGEIHLRNVRQLTFGGENAEAYFSPDGRELIFQSTRDGAEADQIFIMAIDGSHVRRVSTGKGRTTCAYFLPEGKRIFYASTHLAGDAPPPKPTYEHGYVWPVYAAYDIFSARPDGSDLVRLTATGGYDAEGTAAADGSRIVFTSARDGDLEVYSMKPDGSDPRRLTNSPGYDGGAFYSPDGRLVCFRAHEITDPQEAVEFTDLLAAQRVRPSTLEIYVMKADGTERRRLTSNGAANFCPCFHPDGKRLIFASNVNDPKGRNFDLFLIGTDGKNLEQVTFNETFDGFPMFSPDGKKLVFCSNRDNKEPHETNVFIADWVENAAVTR